MYQWVKHKVDTVDAAVSSREPLRNEQTNFGHIGGAGIPNGWRERSIERNIIELNSVQRRFYSRIIFGVYVNLEVCVDDCNVKG
jgi:hypothetical protein